MKITLFIPFIFSFFGYLFSCFLTKIGDELPLEMTREDYKYVFLNSLAISYSLIGLFLGIIISFLIIRILKKLK